MFKAKAAFSGFSVNDLAAAKTFYTEKLWLKVEHEGDMGLTVHLPQGNTVFVYPKDDHQPATFTILNFVVDSIDRAVEELKNRGVTFEQYQDMPQDEKGILRGLSQNMGPDIAWFKDPAGNILSVLQDSRKT
ncbi:MAG TPA: VOC family protein [Candidatus Saccharimonadales bacterium]|nr:VOC family protein [Candidatus Saccharimonadales bacterium]